MKLEPWEPDLRTILARIDEGELDLQPEFQRGLAWNPAKQQRLIDSVLRGWATPPLHLLVLQDQSTAVLDGQQRLRSFQLFVKNKLRVGRFAPFDAEIDSYVGARFEQLPEVVRRRVFNYKVSCYRLYDYLPEEPYELFFRLNLPTGLTQAEKRNALVGESRMQIRQLVQEASQLGWSTAEVGFANARMAYDDIIARLCVCVEEHSLRIPLTSGRIEQYYRRERGFSASTITSARDAIERVTSALNFSSQRIKLNKATLLTWLLVAVRETESRLDVDLGQLMLLVESGRASLQRSTTQRDIDPRIRSRAAIAYLEIYNDRASLRVTDVLSVVARDVAVWRLAAITGLLKAPVGQLETLLASLRTVETDSDYQAPAILERLEDPNLWGVFA